MKKIEANQMKKILMKKSSEKINMKILRSRLFYSRMQKRSFEMGAQRGRRILEFDVQHKSILNQSLKD